VAVERSFPSAAVVNKTHKIGNMIEPLVTGERGEVAVVAFDSQVDVRQDFTTDFEKVATALRNIRSGNYGARMVDAVAESVRMLAQRPPERRRVLLLISEERDRHSRTKLDAAITLAQQENVAIYPLTYSPYRTAFTAKAGTTPPPDHTNENPLVFLPELFRLAQANAAEAFAKYTGGERLSFSRQKALEQAVARIGEELHSQYLLSFAAPPGAAGTFHAISVSVPGQPGSKVRTRAGYWLAEAQP
jgi:VWFA-related protein